MPQLRRTLRQVVELQRDIQELEASSQGAAAAPKAEEVEEAQDPASQEETEFLMHVSVTGFNPGGGGGGVEEQLQTEKGVGPCTHRSGAQTTPIRAKRV